MDGDGGAARPAGMAPEAAVEVNEGLVDEGGNYWWKNRLEWHERFEEMMMMMYIPPELTAHVNGIHGKVYRGMGLEKFEYIDYIYTFSPHHKQFMWRAALMRDRSHVRG
jgi:hypothetical protein